MSLRFPRTDPPHPSVFSVTGLLEASAVVQVGGPHDRRSRLGRRSGATGVNWGVDEWGRRGRGDSRGGGIRWDREVWNDAVEALWRCNGTKPERTDDVE